MGMPEGEAWTDELVRAAIDRCAEARERVLRTLARRLPAMVAVRLSPSPAQEHVVEDLAQQALIGVADALPGMHEPTAAALGAMASIIVSRRVADFLRT